MSIELEKGVAIPETSGGRGRKGKYPFRKMEVMDSFFVEGEKKEYNRVSTSACKFALRNPGIKFTVRKVDGGVRCWRVK